VSGRPAATAQVPRKAGKQRRLTRIDQ